MKALLSEATANRQFAYMCGGGGGRGVAERECFGEKLRIIVLGPFFYLTAMGIWTRN